MPAAARILPVLALSLCALGPAGASGGGSLSDPPRPVRSADEAARVAAVTAPATDFTAPEPFEARPVGAGTAMDGAYAAPLANLPPARGMDVALGEALFEKLWVPAPTATRASDGLGPLFNARSCAGCHPGDGRGAPFDGTPRINGMVLKLGRPDLAGQPGHPVAPDPRLGRQLQDRAMPGVPNEGAVGLDWTEEVVPLSGGETVSLRRPVARVTPALAPETATSLRLPPQLGGVGLLEAVPEADILVLADPEDADGDGISGRAARVHSPAAGATRLGRFGWKAEAASLADMAASAFSTDMGLSTPLFPDPAGDCTAAEAACQAAPTGEDAGLRDGREVSGEALGLVTAYLAALGQPAREGLDDPQVLTGKAAFHAAGCIACHRPKFVTARDGADPARSFQLIWPYTDLLLHDMGPDLADALPGADASGAEWRTPALWGIGRASAVLGRPASYLHDGRARSLLEAVLWHGGEAQGARDRVAAMAPETRAALIRFLESL